MPSEEEVRSLVERIVDGVIHSENHKTSDGPHTDTAGIDTGSATSESDGTGTIAIGSDHGGYPLKERLVFKLRETGWDVIDCGTDSHESVDYPAFAETVAKKVAEQQAQWGIVVDGAGIGSSMVANKVPGVRAALCYDISSARNSREHNHANVLTLGAGLIGDGLAWQIVEEWLSTEWAGGRHARRVAMIDAVDQQYSSTE